MGQNDWWDAFGSLHNGVGVLKLGRMELRECIQQRPACDVYSQSDGRRAITARAAPDSSTEVIMQTLNDDCGVVEGISSKQNHAPTRSSSHLSAWQEAQSRHLIDVCSSQRPDQPCRGGYVAPRKSKQPCIRQWWATAAGRDVFRGKLLTLTLHSGFYRLSA